ncbi:MAG: Asp-tRNA(Asn)/Glu-tRNA(Gln) amidotransferase subunit GatC [bacterium]
MTKTTLTDNDFAKLVKQANLVLSGDEKSKIHAQLDEALSAVKVLDELDTTKVSQTTSASGLTNVFRDDVVTPSFSQAEALQNAKMTHNGYFIVPAIFEAMDN